MIVDWQEIVFIYLGNCVLWKSVHFKRIYFLLFNLVASKVYALFSPLISVTVPLHKLSEGVAIHEVALLTVTIVGQELPLVPIRLSKLKLPFLDFHNPILFFSVKGRVIVTKLVSTHAPENHKSTETGQMVSDIIKQNKLVGVWVEHLALPVTDTKTAYVV